ncbi:RidA family protein [Streptomyces sp. NPDC056437]|uniref:RidA family protein n=1 Tax=Streptomyces sp. NPDC056437 TaxID=3345816 RepID=UPI00369ECEB1
MAHLPIRTQKEIGISVSDSRTKTAIIPASHSDATGPYSPGSQKGGIVQTAGQLGLPPGAPQPRAADEYPSLAAQVFQALDNVTAVLAEAGSGWADVIMVRVHLTDTAHFQEFNTLYAEYLATEQGSLPARTTVYVGLPAGFLVEIDALAVLG